MGNPDKADIKAHTLGELVASLDDTMRAAGDNRQAMRASVDTLERVLERFHGYRSRVDTALEDGTFPADSRDAVLAVFGDLVRMTDQLRQQVAKAHAEAAPYMQGLAKARELAAHQQRVQQRAAERARADSDEEEAYRAELEARRQAKGDTDPVAPAAPARPVGAPQGAKGAKAGRGTPAPPAAPVGPPQGEPAAPACAHCGDAMTTDSGSEHCVPCVSHRNRYGALPSERVLRKRRGPRAADS